MFLPSDSNKWLIVRLCEKLIQSCRAGFVVSTGIHWALDGKAEILSVFVFSLQRVCKQLHLYTAGKPEEVRVSGIGSSEDICGKTSCSSVCLF